MGNVIDKNELDDLRKGGWSYEINRPATEQQIGNAVNTWLNEHPEATTTVADGSITEKKLADELVTKLLSSGGGMNATASNLLIEILQYAIYSSNVSGKIEQLQKALALGGDTPVVPDEPDEPAVVDDITVSGGVMTIISVGSEITVSSGVMAIA